MKKNKFIKSIGIIIICFLFNNFTKAQSYYLPLNNDFISNYEPLFYQNEQIHTNIKPYILSNLGNSLTRPATINLINLNNILIDPIIQAYYNYDKDEKTNYSNYSVGADLNYAYKDNLHFNLNFSYNRSTFDSLTSARIDSTEIVPHFGEINKKVNKNTFDYLFINGYVSYSFLKYFNIQVGKDKNFWSDGYRSLLLSDNSNSHPFIKLSTNIGKIKYVVLYSWLRDIDWSSKERKLQNKFSNSHILSANIGKRFNAYLFETVIWQAKDSLHNRGFDVNYVNPVLFLRPQEFNIGSPDNVLLGLGFRARIFKNSHFYGQAILDEFKTKEVFKNTGWWANKQGFQVGFKSFHNISDITKLSFLVEYNYIRPFTYAYHRPMINYGAFTEPLAHPDGANIKEIYSNIRLTTSTSKALSIFASLDYKIYGENINNQNYGKDIYQSYLTRAKEYNNYTAQGLETKDITAELKVGYLLKSKLQLELGLAVNTIKNSLVNNSNLFIFGGIKTLLYN